MSSICYTLGIPKRACRVPCLLTCGLSSNPDYSITQKPKEKSISIHFYFEDGETETHKDSTTCPRSEAGFMLKSFRL